MTWSGGASSVSKADWSPLFGREVVIWPDNDEAGFRAGTQVCEELKKIGSKEIYIVDNKELFEKLPPKWDLADPLPSQVESSFLDLCLKEEDKNRFQQSVLSELDLKNKLSFENKLRMTDLLYLYEMKNKERFEEDLSKNLSPAEKDTIYLRHTHEGVTFLQREKEIYKKVATDPEINASGKLAERLTYQIHIYEACHGKTPTEKEVLLMKTTIQNSVKDLASISSNGVSRNIQDLAIDRSLKAVCEKSLKGQEFRIDKSDFIGHIQSEMSHISKQRDIEIVQNQALEKEISITKDRSHGLTL